MLYLEGRQPHSESVRPRGVGPHPLLHDVVSSEIVLHFPFRFLQDLHCFREIGNMRVLAGACSRTTRAPEL